MIDYDHTYDRRLRGEELHGLSLEELKKLEKTLEGGISRVSKTKVCVSFPVLRTIMLPFLICCKSSANKETFPCSFQSEMFEKEIAALQTKVRIPQLSYFCRAIRIYSCQTQLWVRKNDYIWFPFYVKIVIIVWHLKETCYSQGRFEASLNYGLIYSLHTNFGHQTPLYRKLTQNC